MSFSQRAARLVSALRAEFASEGKLTATGSAIPEDRRFTRTRTTAGDTTAGLDLQPTTLRGHPSGPTRGAKRYLPEWQADIIWCI